MAAIDDAGFDVSYINKPQQPVPLTQQQQQAGIGSCCKDLNESSSAAAAVGAAEFGSSGRHVGGGSSSSSKGGCRGPAGKQLTIQQKEVARWQRRFIVAAAFTLPVFLWSMTTMFNPTVNAADMSLTVVNSLPVSWLIMLALATVVQVHTGSVFYVAAYKGLKRGTSNMSLLVALGTTAAFVYSLVSLVLAALRPSYMGHVYFETSAMVLSFICLGKWLEAKAKVRQGRGGERGGQGGGRGTWRAAVEVGLSLNCGLGG